MVSLGTIVFLVAFALWVLYFTLFMLRFYTNNLRHLLKPNVNTLRDCEAGARYDAVNFSIWRSIALGIFLVPIRIFCVISIMCPMYVWVNTFRSFYNGKKSQKFRKVSNLKRLKSNWLVTITDN
jgi:1-acyl-sn-glycerol-3-phosphate acyltransferase